MQGQQMCSRNEKHKEDNSAKERPIHGGRFIDNVILIGSFLAGPSLQLQARASRFQSTQLHPIIIIRLDIHPHSLCSPCYRKLRCFGSSSSIPNPEFLSP